MPPQPDSGSLSRPHLIPDVRPAHLGEHVATDEQHLVPLRAASALLDTDERVLPDLVRFHVDARHIDPHFAAHRGALDRVDVPPATAGASDPHRRRPRGRARCLMPQATHGQARTAVGAARGGRDTRHGRGREPQTHPDGIALLRRPVRHTDHAQGLVELDPARPVARGDVRHPHGPGREPLTAGRVNLYALHLALEVGDMLQDDGPRPVLDPLRADEQPQVAALLDPEGGPQHTRSPQPHRQAGRVRVIRAALTSPRGLSLVDRRQRVIGRPRRQRPAADDVIARVNHSVSLLLRPAGPTRPTRSAHHGPHPARADAESGGRSHSGRSRPEQ